MMMPLKHQYKIALAGVFKAAFMCRRQCLDIICGAIFSEEVLALMHAIFQKGMSCE